MRKTKIKYRVNNLSTELLNEIIVNNYGRHIKGGEIRDYWDQRDDIETVLYNRRQKAQQIKLTQHEKELFQFEEIQRVKDLLRLDKFKKIKSDCIMIAVEYLEQKIGVVDALKELR